MKTKIRTNAIRMLLMLLLVVQVGAAYAAKPLIIVVADNLTTPSSANYMVDFLKGIYGTKVDIEFKGDEYKNLLATDTAKIAHLNSAALIYSHITTVNSGDYLNTDANAAAWNALTPKMIETSSWFVRTKGTGGKRLRWYSADGIGNILNFTTMDVPAAAQSDPLFNGVTITNNQVQLFDTITTVSTVTNDMVGNSGTQLGWSMGTVNRPLLTKWAQSATTFYSGTNSIYAPTNDRLYIGFLPYTAADNYLDPTAHMTAAGKRLLTNIFTSMLPVPADANAASLDITPSSLNVVFPAVDVTATSIKATTATVTLKNNGNAAMTFTRQGSETYQGLVVRSISGPQAIHIKSVSPNPSAGLAVGASLEVVLEYSPTLADKDQNSAADLAIYTNDPAHGVAGVHLEGLAVPVEMSHFKAE